MMRFRMFSVISGTSGVVYTLSVMPDRPHNGITGHAVMPIATYSLCYKALLLGLTALTHLYFGYTGVLPKYQNVVRPEPRYIRPHRQKPLYQ